MIAVVEWLDEHSGAVQALSTVVLIIVTWRYVALTGRLLRLQERSAQLAKAEAMAELKALANWMGHAINQLLETGAPEALDAIRGDAWLAKAARLEHLSAVIGGRHRVNGAAVSTLLREWETKTRQALGGSPEERSVWEQETRKQLRVVSDLLRDMEWDKSIVGGQGDD